MIKEAEIVEYFKSLTYEGQRKFYGKLSPHHKSPSYALGFDLNPRGVALMGRAIQYCAEKDIHYTPKKVHTKRVKFVFETAQARNATLLGAMGGKCVKTPDSSEITCTFKEVDDE